jgi:hypothetical protein
LISVVACTPGGDSEHSGSDDSERPTSWAPTEAGLYSQRARDALRDIRGIGDNEKDRLNKAFDQFQRRSRIATHLAQNALADSLKARVAGQVRFSSGVIDRYMDQYLADKIDQDALKKYFQKNKAKYGQRRIRVAHIVIRDEPQADAPENEARKRAENVLAELESGADFGEVATRYSDDAATADKGGEIGWLRAREASQAIRKAVANLDEGAVSEPVETRRGIQIFKLLERSRTESPSFESVKSRVRYDLKQKLRSEEFERLASKALGEQ